MLGIPAGGGASGLDVRTAAELPIIDVRKLSKGKNRDLADLFDRLEQESRRLGGAVTQEDLEKLQPLIDKIDERIATVLGLKKKVVRNLRSIVEVLIERRISRASMARPEAVRGEEIPTIKPPKKTGSKTRKRVPGKRLEMFFTNEDLTQVD